MVDESNLLEKLLKTEQKWADAHLSLDLNALEDILSDQYRQIQSDGSVIEMGELLTSYRSGNRRWNVAESDEHEVRILGDVAILIGRWRGAGINNGEAFDYAARFLAVYQLEDGDWKLIADVSVPINE
jgi:ketosteroid isomerase-like protein